MVELRAASHVADVGRGAPNAAPVDTPKSRHCSRETAAGRTAANVAEVKLREGMRELSYGAQSALRNESRALTASSTWPRSLRPRQLVG